MSRRENSATLYNYVKNYIMKLIVSGSYPEGSKLPTEYTLMEELNVGRATVRTALSQLENEGVIYKKQGIGTFVSKREKNSELMPFLSLTLIMNKLDLTNENKILNEFEETVSDGFLTEIWDKGTKLHAIKRVRYVENKPLIIDTNFIPQKFFNIAGLADSKDASLTGTLLKTLSRDVSSIRTNSVVRKPTDYERSILQKPENEDVIEVTQWVFIKDCDYPVSCSNFIIPMSVLNYPFLG